MIICACVVSFPSVCTWVREPTYTGREENNALHSEKIPYIYSAAGRVHMGISLLVSIYAMWWAHYHHHPCNLNASRTIITPLQIVVTVLAGYENLESTLNTITPMQFPDFTTEFSRSKKYRRLPLAELYRMIRKQDMMGYMSKLLCFTTKYIFFSPWNILQPWIKSSWYRRRGFWLPKKVEQ